MNDPRLSPEQLEAAVDYAYGGAAFRNGRREQARALAGLFRKLESGPARQAGRRRGK